MNTEIMTNSVDELFSILNNTFWKWPNFIFRGHTQSEWLLESTLSRALKNLKSTDKDILMIEHLDRFKMQIRGRRGVNPKELTENELWALGQHFGLFTPLLDWSYSPYVALFFALAETEKSRSGYRVVWAFNTGDVSAINKWYIKKKTSMRKIEIVNPYLDENSRLVSQNALFTKINIMDDVETLVKEVPPAKWITLCKIKIAEELRDSLLSYLDQMNINYSSLFPDLQGSSLYSNLKLNQTDYIFEQQQKEWEDHTSED